MSNEPTTPPEDPKQRYAKTNLVIAFVAPFAIAIIGGLLIFVTGKSDPYIGLAAIIFPIIGIVPLLGGYITSLRWKTKAPVAFFFTGFGLSLAFGCVWSACVWGFCTR
tara:strand:- start:6339 stop:6662 length:324 start_codon:yes stop_codon:yes gene_type:complete